MTQQKEQDLKHTDYSRVQTIIASMMHDMKNTISHGTAGFGSIDLQPYYFPLDATEYQLQVRETLSQDWIDQSITGSEMRQLLSNETFLVYLGLEIFYMKEKINSFNAEWIKRALMSLYQLFTASVVGFKSHLCGLANVLTQAVKKNMPETWSSLGVVKDVVDNWLQSCQSQGLDRADNRYWDKIAAEYKKLQ